LHPIGDALRIACFVRLGLLVSGGSLTLSTPYETASRIPKLTDTLKHISCYCLIKQNHHRNLGAFMKLKIGLTLWLFGAGLIGISLPSASAAMQELPEGSYQYSCMGCMRNLDMLTCTCPDDKGMMKAANLHLAACNREVSNKDGRLVCGG